MATVEGDVVLAVSHLASQLGELVSGPSYEGTTCSCSADITKRVMASACEFVGAVNVLDLPPVSPSGGGGEFLKRVSGGRRSTRQLRHRPRSVAEELRGAVQRRLIAIDDDTALQRGEGGGCDTTGVAARQMNRRRHELLREVLNRLLEEVQPFRIVGRPRPLTEKLVIRQSVLEPFSADVTDLLQFTVDTQRESEAGAQCQHELGAAALATAQGGELRVIDDAHVAPSRLAQGVLERESAPLGFQDRIDVRSDTSGSREVSRTDHVTIVELAGEPDPDGLGTTLGDALTQQLDQSLGRARVRRGLATNRLQEFALDVDVAKLDVRRANVNGKNLLLMR